MRNQFAITAMIALAVFSIGRLAAPANVNDFINYSLVNASNNVLLPGRLHIPADYSGNPNTERPLILFLHGSGESGTNNTSQINGNIDNLLTAAKARGAFLYAPQTNIGWSSSGLNSNAMTMIDRSIADLSVDPNRVYVTGLSMGGGGTWNFLNQFRDRFAASAPICGVFPTSGFAPAALLDEPIWAFHGRFDSVVPATVTRSVVNAIASEAGLAIPTYPPLNTFGPNVQFDFPPLNLHYTDMRGGHGIWPEVYNTPALYDWMFAQSHVPEPSMLTLGTIALMIFTGRHRRLRNRSCKL